MFFTAQSPNDLRPAFFELYAQEHLFGSFQPGFAYLLEAAAVRHDGARALHRRSDELFALLLAAIETHSLLRHGGTVTEIFYGLRRIHRGSSSDPFDARLARHQPDRCSTATLVLKSLLAHVLLPFLRRKADAWYQGARTGTSLEDAQRGPVGDSAEPTVHVPLLARQLRIIYPALTLVHDSSNFVCNLLYLFEKTPYFSPFLALTRLVVRRMSPTELSDSSSPASTTTSSSSSASSLASWSDRAMTAVKLSLIGGVFLFKLLEYYYSAGNASSPAIRQSVPQPPQPLHRSVESSVGEPTTSNCPICSRTRRRPAVCTSSGYVFCHDCISQAVGLHGCCPVTRLPATHDQIRTLYDA